MVTLSDAIQEYDGAQLVDYLQEEIINNGNQKEVMKMMKWTFPDGEEIPCTSLQLSLYKNKSKEVIFKLMNMGGRELVMVKNGRKSTALQIACDRENPSMDIISKLLEVRGTREWVMEQNQYKDTALHYACRNEKASLDIISKLIDIGGRELVMVTDQDDDTALHYACQHKNPSLDIISKLVDVGGRDLLMVKNSYEENTALIYACANKNVSLDIVSKLVDVGGRDLLMVKDCNEKTALHYACWDSITNARSLDIILKLVDVGGRDMLMVKNSYGETALHYACWNITNASSDIISKLVDVGGRELVIVDSKLESTALHYVCRNANVSIDMISKLIEVGGKELLAAKNTTGNTAIHEGYFNIYGGSDRATFDDVFDLLLKECILGDIGGEFGIGGLFNVATRKEVQNKIYQKWDQLSPSLNSVIESLQEQQRPLILHAAILAKAPLNVIQSIIHQFQYSVLKTDSLNRYPIVVAFEEGLEWSEGLQQIVEATAIAQQQHPSIYTAAQYGLKWTHYMKELTKTNSEEIMDGHDSLMGLRPFMVAAVGDYHDLSGIFSMMRMSPQTNAYVGLMDAERNKRRRLLE